MPTILLRKEHRADHLTNVEQAAFSRALWVIDLQPDMLSDEAASIDGGLAKCSSCSFVSFLSGVPERSQYVGLDPLAATFGAAHALTSAAKRGDSASVLRITGEIGAAAIFEVVSDREREQRLLPAIEAISRHERSPATVDGTSWALVEPDAEGPSGLSARIRMKAAAGYRRILVGYLDHAAATERWNTFVERDEFDDEWLSFLLEMRSLSIEQLVFSMSYPPCSTLQWRANRPLEARRARLDQHFRVVSGDASLMCAENVSGYALLNDNRELDLPGLRCAKGFAIKLDRLLMVF